MPILQIKTVRHKVDKIETSHYKATVSRLRARFIITLNYNSLKGEMKIDGFPDVGLLK